MMMVVPHETQTRLDELKKLLGQQRLSRETKVIGSVLLDVCERLERLAEQNLDQDELLRPEAHRRI
jgi:hypothetical protein